MARPTSPVLTPAELRVMQVLWRLGPSTATAIVDDLADQAGARDSTIRTILRILERKGHVRHKVDGKAFIYRATVAEGDAQRGAVREVLERFFDNSPERLMLNLLKNGDVDRKELTRLRRLIDEADK
jgi:predicted transcriptional regulator